MHWTFPGSGSHHRGGGLLSQVPPGQTHPRHPSRQGRHENSPAVHCRVSIDRSLARRGSRPAALRSPRPTHQPACLPNSRAAGLQARRVPCPASHPQACLPRACRGACPNGVGVVCLWVLPLLLTVPACRTADPGHRSTAAENTQVQSLPFAPPAGIIRASPHHGAAAATLQQRAADD